MALADHPPPPFIPKGGAESDWLQHSTHTQGKRSKVTPPERTWVFLRIPGSWPGAEHRQAECNILGPWLWASLGQHPPPRARCLRAPPGAVAYLTDDPDLRCFIPFYNRYVIEGLLELTTDIERGAVKWDAAYQKLKEEYGGEMRGY